MKDRDIFGRFRKGRLNPTKGTGKKYYCSCGKEKSKKKYKKCRVCNAKLRSGKNSNLYGKHSFTYKGVTDHKCYCKCGKEICFQTFYYGEKHCHSCDTKLRFTSIDYKNKIIKKLLTRVSPNKPEKVLIELIKKLNLDFKYVGDGNFFIKGYNPDFIDIKNKKIIEVFGDYWHNRLDYKKRDNKKKYIYRRNGYKTLIIWEHELKDLNKVINSLYKFIRR